jgi:hypothetical protein
MVGISFDFLGVSIIPSGGMCESCTIKQNQINIARDAITKLRRRAVLSLVTKSALRKKHLPKILIETKIAQMKAQNLWRTPKI